MMASIDIQKELRKLVEPSPLSHDEIQKIVENSQRIEGYEPASFSVKKRVEALISF